MAETEADQLENRGLEEWNGYKKWYPIIKPEMNQSILDGKLQEKTMLQYIASLIEKDYKIKIDLI